jgi:hypothetical protein
MENSDTQKTSADTFLGVASAAPCSASPFPGRLVQHVSPNLTHSLFMAVWKLSYHDKWQGSHPYESLDELHKQYSWAFQGDYEVRVYELQLPTGASPLQNAEVTC